MTGTSVTVTVNVKVEQALLPSHILASIEKVPACPAKLGNIE